MERGRDRIFAERMKILKSVSHNIAHHAVSGLSYIHPHLRRACRKLDIDVSIFNLLDKELHPKDLAEIEPLRLAFLTLRGKFDEILKSEGFRVEDLKEAKLEFRFPAENLDDYCSDCNATLIHQSGKEFCSGVNWLGLKITPKLWTDI